MEIGKDKPVTLLVVGFILFVSLFGFIYGIIHPIQIYYEYIDLDNNNGIAEYCSYKFNDAFKGGQGSPICELKDGTILQVKQYKKIESEEKI